MDQKGHSETKKQLRGSPITHNIGHTPPSVPHLLLTTGTDETIDILVLFNVVIDHSQPHPRRFLQLRISSHQKHISRMTEDVIATPLCLSHADLAATCHSFGDNVGVENSWMECRALGQVRRLCDSPFEGN